MVQDAGTPGYQIETVTLHEQPVLAVHGTVQDSEVGEFVGQAFERVAKVASEDGMHISGAPFARIHPAPEGALEIEAGFPVTGVGLGQGDVQADHLPGGQALRTLHRGSYAQAQLAHEALHTFASEHAMTPVGDAWEVYLDGPEVAQPRTLVVLPTRPPGDAAAAATTD